MEFDKRPGSTTMDKPVKFQSNTKNQTTHMLQLRDVMISYFKRLIVSHTGHISLGVEQPDKSFKPGIVFYLCLRPVLELS